MFKINDDHLVVKVPIFTKVANDVLPEFESFVFNEKAESDMSYCENGGQLIEKPYQSKNESDVCDEVKIPLARASDEEIIFEKLGDLARMLEDTLLNEEEEIMYEFLSSLKPNYLFHDDLGIHSN